MDEEYLGFFFRFAHTYRVTFSSWMIFSMFPLSRSAKVPASCKRETYSHSHTVQESHMATATLGSLYYYKNKLDKSKFKSKRQRIFLQKNLRGQGDGSVVKVTAVCED